jgi:peptide/nickel transport system substrate-binding protein
MFRVFSKKFIALLSASVIAISGSITMGAANADTSKTCNLTSTVENAVCDEIVYGTLHRVGQLDRVGGSGTGGYTDLQMSYITGGLLYRFDEFLVPRRDLVERKTTSLDGLTVTLKLRTIKYSDGTPFNAKDVVVAFERWAASGASPSFISKISSMVAVTPNTLKINLKSLYPDIDYALAQPYFMIHPADRVKTPAMANDYFKKPVSLGPMKVKQYTPGADVSIYDINPNYWAKPVVKVLKVVYMPDATSRQLALQQGTIDYAFELALTAKKELSAQTVNVFPHFDPGTFMLAINMNPEQPNAALKDPRVRRAISAAVDRAQIMAIAFGGLAKPNCGMQFNVNNPLYVCSLPKKGARDVALAKKLLAEAGYSQGFKMKLVYPNRVLWPEANAIIKQNLLDVGIDVTLLPEPDVNISPNYILKKNWEIMWFGNNAPTPILQLSNWFAIGGLWALNVGTGLATVPDDVKMNKLLDDAASTKALNARKKLLTELEGIAYQSSHFIPIGTRYRLSGTRIADGIARPPIPGDLYFHIGMNPSLPKK